MCAPVSVTTAPVGLVLLCTKPFASNLRPRFTLGGNSLGLRIVQRVDARTLGDHLAILLSGDAPPACNGAVAARLYRDGRYRDAGTIVPAALRIIGMRACQTAEAV